MPFLMLFCSSCSCAVVSFNCPISRSLFLYERDLIRSYDHHARKGLAAQETRLTRGCKEVGSLFQELVERAGSCALLRAHIIVCATAHRTPQRKVAPPLAVYNFTHQDLFFLASVQQERAHGCKRHDSKTLRDVPIVESMIPSLAPKSAALLFRRKENLLPMLSADYRSRRRPERIHFRFGN